MHLITRSSVNLLSFIHCWLCLPRIHHGAVIDVEKPKVLADGSCPRLYPSKLCSCCLTNLFVFNVCTTDGNRDHGISHSLLASVTYGIVLLSGLDSIRKCPVFG